MGDMGIMNSSWKFIELACDLERVGLVWNPEIGDEVSSRERLERVSVLVDPDGLPLHELRQTFVWLPSVEQLISQFEAREALIYHAGINSSFSYEAVIKTAFGGVIETAAVTLRLAFGQALRNLIKEDRDNVVH